MSTTISDKQIIAALTEKFGAAFKGAEYDDNGNLLILNLSRSGLSQVPVELGQLTNLQRLHLNDKGKSYKRTEGHQ